MATRDLRFKITAEDDASQSFQRIARSADRSMSDVEEALDDSRTAGKRLADSLNADLDEVEAAMRGTREAADALGRSLGPELSGKVDLTEAATKFQRLGLTVDEVKADADELADHLRRLNDVQTRDVTSQIDSVDESSRRAKGGTDELAAGARGANSALANMVGNSAQDLGGLLGVTGSLGVGIGQMGEYASDATIETGKLGQSLMSMVRVAGPIAALGLVIQSVGDVQDRFADSTERTNENVKNWSDAMEEGGDVAQNYARHLKEADEVLLDVTRSQSGLQNVLGEYNSSVIKAGAGTLLLGKLLGASSEEARDITPLLAKAGISAEEFAKAASDPKAYDTQVKLADALRNTTLSADEQDAIIETLAQHTEDYTTAKKNHEVTSQVFTDGLKSERDAMLAAKIAEGQRVDSLDASREAADKTARATAELEGATMRAENAARQMSAAWDALTGALDAERAIQNLGTDFDDMREKARVAWEKTAAGADDAKAAQDEYAASVLTAKENVVTLGRQIGLSVPEVKSMLLQIEDGQIDDVERRLQILTRNRSMNLSIITHGGPGYGDSNPASGKNERAKGGPVEAGGAYWVGDKFGTNSAAAELFVPDQDGTIYNQDQIARGGTPTRGGGGAPVYNLTVNAGLGANGAEIGRVLVSELKKYNRMNGTGWMK